MKITVSRNKREGFYVGSSMGYHCREHVSDYVPYWKKHRDALWAHDLMLSRLRTKFPLTTQ